MNRPDFPHRLAGAPLAPYARSERVTYAERSYIATEDDLDEPGVWTRDGIEYGTGRNKLGFTVTLPLNIPLCNGCDKPIIDHICPDCELVFTDQPPELDPANKGGWVG